MRTSRSAGRPAGSESTRDEILKSARSLFAASGYGGTSIRTIATTAGVDPSTVMHFFGTKEKLFQVVVAEISLVLEPVANALRNRASGEELARTYLEVWQDEEAGAAMQAIVRAAFESDQVLALFKAGLTNSILAEATAATGDPLKAELLIGQLIALGLTRHVLQLPSMAQADISHVASSAGQALDTQLSR